MLNRYPQNPILSPISDNSWENYAVFNGSIIKKENLYFLFYRAMGKETEVEGKKIRLSTIGKASSYDGINFTKRELFLKPECPWELYGCEDPRVTKIEDTYLIFYTALSSYPPNYQSIKVAVALSNDLETIIEKHLVTPFNAKAMTFFPEKINGLYTGILTVNTDKPPAKIAICQFAELKNLWDPNFWREWYQNIEKYTLPITRVSSDHPEIGAAPIKCEKGWLLFHSYIKHYFSANTAKEFRIEAKLLDLNNPQKIIGRTEQPLLMPKESYEKNGQISNIVFPSGAILENNKIKVYYGAADKYCALAEIDYSSLLKEIEVNAPSVFRLKKFPNNPLLEPLTSHSWESKVVFNPGVLKIDNQIYLLYRAMGEDNVSNLGLAVSSDGLYVDERLPDPIYPLRMDFEKPHAGGSGGGAEDGRLTIIGDKIYMCYTAFDGQTPKLAFTSITVGSFLKRQWDDWTLPKIISPPNLADKNGALFPEKINNNYVFFHRVEPNIVLDEVEDLEFRKKIFLGFKSCILPRTMSWDEVKIGIGGPPIQTKMGWLVFYHGISRVDGYYRLGAMLLKNDNPSVVLARTNYPILEPEFYFEKEGLVNNVVFSCGQANINDEIYLYYGGADKVICGARCSLEELIDYLVRTEKKKYLSYP